MLIKNIKIILPILILILFIILCQKYFNTGNDKFTNLEKEINNNKITYLFWTGGYDSTFRLCQLVFDENKTVQPIYVSDIIDNKINKNTRRKSTKNEINTMNIILKKIKKKDENKYNNIKELIIIKKVNIDYDISEAINNLYKKGRMRRPVCQYGGLAQVTRDLNKNVEMSVEYAPISSMMFKNVFHTLEEKNNNYYIKDNLDIEDKDLYIFKKCSFPTIMYSKEDMLKIARNSNYDDILKITWSCWYPRNNKPCEKCIMCRERII